MEADPYEWTGEGEVLSDPAPILRQFILNQLSNGEAVVSAATGAIGGFLEYISPTIVQSHTLQNPVIFFKGEDEGKKVG